MNDNYLDRINPNLVVSLHFLGKSLWIFLACVFAWVGFKLYAIGITAVGDAEIGAPGILSMSLKNAGPGLVVMVVALACAVIGAVRARVELTKDRVVLLGADNSSERSDSLADLGGFNLFKDIARDYVAHVGCAFVVLNSGGHIDIASAGWRAVPEELREAIVNTGTQWMARTRDMEWVGSIQEWQVMRKKILIPLENSVHCAIFVTPPAEEYRQKIAVEETRAIYIT